MRRIDSCSVLLALTLLMGCVTGSTPTQARNTTVDLRMYMHGIEAVKNDNGRYSVVFSSSGLPPKGEDRNGNWTHDVYASDWGIGDGNLSPIDFISRPEAQEPVSVARTKDGHIMITFEDGYNTANEVAQRYGVYGANLSTAIKPYPNDVMDGGHSGHVAATDTNFVVFYSNDWVDGGGVDNLGTGKGVYITVYDSNGNNARAVKVAPNVREWWPVLSASPTKAMLIWQQFVKGQTYANLRMAVLDPAAGKLTVAPVTLQPSIQYYTYKTSYVPSLDEFLVTGTTFAGKGFAYLVNPSGVVTASLPCMPATVREAGITVDGGMAYTPTADGRLMQLALTPTSITLQALQTSPIAWSYTGSLGIMRSTSQLHWMSETKGGLLEADFDLSKGTVPTAKDKCQ